ncbi:hypothetical protein [Nocardioides sp. GXQ0305]|uniref:hypothetical protein n=1 Tax=Nocardioides sp. GXQ0305 TaxID=3423912 RepID=UPI003D7D5731
MSPHRHLLAAAAALCLVMTLSLPVTAAADEADPAFGQDQTGVPEPEAGSTTTPSDPATEPEPPNEAAPLPESDPPAEAEPTPSEPPAPPTASEEPVTTDDPEAADDVAGATPEAAVEAAAAAAPQAARRVRAPQPKVTICHRTNSRTNPYNQIVVSEESAIEGHSSHTGPIFSPDVDDWGDIIPPIRPGLPRGLNWPEGSSVLNDGCEVQPDVGPLPDASISDVTCDAGSASVTVTVRDGQAATAPANFTILVDGTPVQTVEAVPPGGSEEVVLSGDLATLEDQTFTIEVRSGGEVIATRVVTVDCEPPPPAVEIGARLACAGTTAQGTVEVTNNGQDPVELTAQVDGVPVGAPLTVGPGATETGTIDLSPYEDQTVVVTLLVDGAVVAAYTVTPDCVAPQVLPRVAVDGVVCPPPSTTVTLANDGDADSRIVFSILIDGKVVQVSAPVYGGDSTTIVGDLSRYEDQTVTVELRANGEVLGSRTVSVDCVSPAEGRRPAGAAAGDEVAVPTVVAAGAAPPSATSADGPRATLPLCLLAFGALLVLVAGGPRRRGAGG